MAKTNSMDGTSDNTSDSAAQSKSTSKTAARRRAGEPYSMPLWMFLTLLLGTAIGVAYFWRHDDLVTASAIGAISLSGWIGFKMGFGQIFASVGALAAAIYFAPSIGIEYETTFGEKFGTTGMTNRILCIAVVGVLISGVVTCILTILSNRVLSRRSGLLRLNHFSGFALGILEGGIMVLLVLGAALSVQLWQRDAPVENNRMAEWIDTVASKTRSSAIGDLVRDNNPFETFEALAQTKQIHKTVQSLRDGQNIDRIMHDPKVTELRSDPEFKNALEAIQQDKEIREFLEEGRPLDRAMILRLMNHPAVLRLLDHEDFRERVKEVAQSL